MNESSRGTRLHADTAALRRYVKGVNLLTKWQEIHDGTD